jgi:hypothetical protein
MKAANEAEKVFPLIMKLGDLIGLLIDRLDHNEITVKLLSAFKIGSSYWKRLDPENKIQYSNMMRKVTQDSPEDTNYHIGDQQFHAIMEGRLPELIAKFKEILSVWYLEQYKSSDDRKTFDFPDKLLNRSENSRSRFILNESLKTTGTYQANPADPESRIRRYVLADSKAKYAFCKTCHVFQINTGTCSTESCRNTESDFDYYNPNPVPPHPKAKKLFFDWLDQISWGIDNLKLEDDRVQQLKIMSGMAPNTNSGYPEFKSQKKQVLSTMWKAFVRNYLPDTYKKHKKLFNTKFKFQWFETDDKGRMRKRSKLIVMGLQVRVILDAVEEAIRRKYYGPFAHFHRLQISDEPKIPKHRSTFGGEYLNKVIGGLVAAAKHYGEYVETAKEHGFPVPENWPDIKYVPTVGGLPFMATLNWDVLFKLLKERMPTATFEDVDEVLVATLNTMTASEIKELFGVPLKEGEYEVNVTGEDFPGYDTGIIVEDIDWIRTHKTLGRLMGWILDCLVYSEVWLGGYRIKDIFYKSGHPMTSPIGSAFHWQVIFHVEDYIRKYHNPDVKLLGGTVLSDDSIFYWIGYSHKWMSEYLKPFGLSIKIEASYDYSKDLVVGFLKVLVGYVLRDKGIVAIGDPISRTLAWLSSETDIEEDITKDDLKGIYEFFPGKIELNSALSKLASCGEESVEMVVAHLETINDTPFGREILRSIPLIPEPEEREVQLYRPDVTQTFPPIWLKRKIDVQAVLSVSHR